MVDYKVVKKSSTEFQKLLNQWKHSYNVEILSVKYDFANDQVFALLMRREKRTYEAA